MLAVIIAALAVILWTAGYRRRKPGQVEMVLLAAAGGEAEAELWASALRGAGIHPHIVNVGDSDRFTSPYAYEVWVRAKDEERAREVLQLG